MYEDYYLIFIHGFTATPQSDWYPEISAELDKLGISYEIPEMPETNHPNAKAWVETITQRVNKFPDDKIILIGHSLGTRAIELYLEHAKISVEQVFLIAAFDNDPSNKLREQKGYSSFFTGKVSFAKIKKMAKKFTVVHSIDDQDIPYSQGKNVAENLNAELITEEGRGHMSDPSNSQLILEILQTRL